MRRNGERYFLFEEILMSVIDMQTMRYINLLDRASSVKTSNCFVYNNTIIYAVPRAFVSRAVGPAASNIRAIQEQLGKKVRVVADSEGLQDADRFIKDVVAPVSYKEIVIANGEITITAGNIQSKASLIGRNIRRYEELKKIVQQMFGLDLRII